MRYCTSQITAGNFLPMAHALIGYFKVTWHLTKLVLFPLDHSLRVLSIQQKLQFEILEIPCAQWNGIFGLHRPNPNHYTLDYCTCTQNTEAKRGTWDNNFVKGTFWPSWPKWPGQTKWTTFNSGPKYSGRTKPNCPFHLNANWNFWNFRQNGKC